LNKFDLQQTLLDFTLQQWKAESWLHFSSLHITWNTSLW